MGHVWVRATLPGHRPRARRGHVGWGPTSGAPLLREAARQHRPSCSHRLRPDEVPRGAVSGSDAHCVRETRVSQAVEARWTPRGAAEVPRGTAGRAEGQPTRSRRRRNPPTPASSRPSWRRTLRGCRSPRVAIEPPKAPQPGSSLRWVDAECVSASDRAERVVGDGIPEPTARRQPMWRQASAEDMSPRLTGEPPGPERPNQGRSQTADPERPGLRDLGRTATRKKQREGPEPGTARTGSSWNLDGPGSVPRATGPPRDGPQVSRAFAGRSDLGARVPRGTPTGLVAVSRAPGCPGTNIRSPVRSLAPKDVGCEAGPRGTPIGLVGMPPPSGTSRDERPTAERSPGPKDVGD